MHSGPFNNSKHTLTHSHTHSLSYTQVLHTRRVRRPTYLPPQNRGSRPDAKSARLNEEPGFAALAPRRCFWVCGPQGDAGAGEDWGAGAG